jgi:tetratricopeptide (TPR) repeat protein
VLVLGAWVHPALSATAVNTRCDQSIDSAPISADADHKLAMRVIDQAVAKADGDDARRFRMDGVIILADAGQTEQSVKALEALVADYPDNAAYQARLLAFYLEAGRVDEAENLLRRLTEREPDDSRWRIRLATMLVRQDRAGDAEASLQEAIADNPGSLQLQLELAAFYEVVAEREKALAIYEKVAAAGPRTPDGLAARNRLAFLNIGRDDERAKELVAGILTDVPDNGDALMLRAAMRAGEARYDEAVTDLRLVLIRRPQSTRALLGLARVQLLNGNPILAEDAYRRLLTVDPANGPANRELAAIVANRGDAEEAELLLRRVLRIQPDDPNVSRNLVRALLLQQDFEGAEAEARRITGTGEESGIADYQLGLALEAQGESQGALEAYGKALQKAPTADAPLNGLVRLLVSLDRSEEAQEFLTAHIAENPQHLRARLLLGEVYASRGRRDLAESEYRDILREQPGFVGAYVGLAALYPRASDEQLGVIREGYEKNSSDPRLGLALGSIYEKRGDYEQAIRTYEDILSRTDDDLVANNLAALLLDFRTDAGSYKRALQLASRFEDRSDPHPFNLAVLGWAYYRNSEYRQATRYLERAVAQAQDAPQVRYYLGMAYLKNDNPVGARQELAAAIDAADQSGATFTGLDEARAALAGLDDGGGSES